MHIDIMDRHYAVQTAMSNDINKSIKSFHSDGDVDNGGALASQDDDDCENDGDGVECNDDDGDDDDGGGGDEDDSDGGSGGNDDDDYEDDDDEDDDEDIDDDDADDVDGNGSDNDDDGDDNDYSAGGSCGANNYFCDSALVDPVDGSIGIRGTEVEYVQCTPSVGDSNFESEGKSLFLNLPVG